MELLVCSRRAPGVALGQKVMPRCPKEQIAADVAPRLTGRYKFADASHVLIEFDQPVRIAAFPAITLLSGPLDDPFTGNRQQFLTTSGSSLSTEPGDQTLVRVAVTLTGVSTQPAALNFINAHTGAGPQVSPVFGMANLAAVGGQSVSNPTVLP